jgi:hypothetical protein
MRIFCAVAAVFLTGCTSVGPSIDQNAKGTAVNSPAPNSLTVTVPDEVTHAQGSTAPAYTVLDQTQTRGLNAGNGTAWRAPSFAGTTSGVLTLKAERVIADLNGVEASGLTITIDTAEPIRAAEGATRATLDGWARLAESEKEARLKEAGVVESAIPGVLKVLDALVGKF